MKSSWWVLEAYTGQINAAYYCLVYAKFLVRLKGLTFSLPVRTEVLIPGSSARLLIVACLSSFLEGFSKYHWGLTMGPCYWLITRSLDVPPLPLVSHTSCFLWSSKTTKIYSLLYPPESFLTTEILTRDFICHWGVRGDYCKYFHWFLPREGEDFMWACTKAPHSYRLRSTTSAITVTQSLVSCDQLFVSLCSFFLLHPSQSLFSILHQQQFFIIPLY